MLKLPDSKTEVNCRKIYSRAKLKLQDDAEKTPVHIKKTETLVKEFLSGTHSGNFSEFVRLLTDDAILITDGGGKRPAALRPIFGMQRIQRLFEGIAAKGSLRGDWITCYINGQLGLVLVREKKSIMVICFSMANRFQKYRSVYMILNPDKLQSFTLDTLCHKTQSDFVL